jgi:hypothetical protein
VLTVAVLNDEWSRAERPAEKEQRVKLESVLAGCALALAACASRQTGSGAGTLVAAPGAPVQFTWTSDDGGQSGTMTAQAGDRTFSGRFFQVRQGVQRAVLEPLWVGWPHGWADWRYFGPVAAEEFATLYSGKVVANLSSADGGRMRCRFHLVNPTAGMAGGGQGECQLEEDGTVDATFAPR